MRLTVSAGKNTIELTCEVNIRLLEVNLQIIYSNNELCRVCTDKTAAVNAYGTEMARKILYRINQISACDSVEQMINYRLGRCHPLKGKRADQYAVDLIQPYRLVFEKENSQEETVRIIEITDYY